MYQSICVVLLASVYTVAASPLDNDDKQIQDVFFSNYNVISEVNAARSNVPDSGSQVSSSATTPKTLKASTLVPGKPTVNADYCETVNKTEGRCVFSYLCNDGQINVDGSDLLDEKSASCTAPKVCCSLELTVSTTTKRPRTLVPGLPSKPTKDQPCKAFDGTDGLCVLVHLCDGDSINQDGSDLLDERGGESCPSWQGALQICCPTRGFVNNTVTTTTTSPTTPMGKITSKPDEEGQKYCTDADGKSGECVPYYQCEQEDYDGHGKIDTRFNTISNCHYSKMCCASEYIDKTKQPTVQNSTQCGIANPFGVLYKDFKVDPQEAKYGEFPWVVVVRTRNGPGPDAFNNSGGALIHPSVVLTAAHYVVRAYNGEIVVRAGAWDLLAVNDPLPRQDVGVRLVESHPEFNNRNKHNDIALLFLKRPMTLTIHVGVVCLPPAGVQQAPSTDCIATGWGKDTFGPKGQYKSILKKVTLPVVDNEDCQNRLRTTRLGQYYNLHASFMCAGGEGPDTCTGDGGSPLACEDNTGRYIYAGVVSWGIECAVKGRPGVYADVSYFRQWIDDRVRAQNLDPSIYTI